MMDTDEMRQFLIERVKKMRDKDVRALFVFLFGEPPASNPYDEIRNGKRYITMSDRWTTGDNPRPIISEDR